MLYLNLFGTPDIYLDNPPGLRFRTRKAQALLIYLAVTKRHWNRDTLAALFWAETDDTTARKNLRDILPTLRRQLGDYLRFTDENIGLDLSSRYKCDVTHFSAMLERPLADVATAALAEALALYRGEFLEGYTTSRISADFELWALRERERLHQLALMGFTTLCQRQQENGAYEAALATNRQLLKLAPWDEASHRQQMVLLAQSGQQAAALAHFETCRQLLADELDVEPDAETVQLCEDIKAGQFRPTPVATLITAENKRRHSPLIATPPKTPKEASKPNVSLLSGVGSPVTPAPTVDWGDAPTVDFFHGREVEQAKLQDWLLDAQPRLLALLGMGGIGKTTLAAKVVRETATQFEVVLWRSLVNSPPLTDLIRASLNLLDPQSLVDLPESLDAQMHQLFVHLQQRRCLLILDNLESILREDRPGEFRVGYEPYDQLLRRFGQSTHQSCLLLTSRECPQMIRRLQAGNPAVRTLPLKGLSEPAGQAIFQALALFDEAPTAVLANVGEIVRRYSGNPLALKLVATTIRDFFGSDPTLFLSNEPLIFDDIRGLLDQQFARLAPREEELLLWLAIEREPVSFKALQANLAHPSSTRLLLESIRALEGRSLLETDQGQMRLQNVVMEYATDRLIARITAELEGWEQRTAASDPWAERFFNRFALQKAQSTTNVRHSQQRLLLQPVAQHLQRCWGATALSTKLKRLRDFLGGHGQGVSGYAAANLIHLYHELKIDLTGADFSGLVIWQADLRHVTAHQIDFSQADLAGSTFMENIHEVRALAISPDGQIMVNANQSGQIDLRQLDTLQLLETFNEHRDIVLDLVFSPDGQLLASADSQSIIVYRKSASYRWHVCLTLNVPGTEIIRLAFSPDSRLLAVAPGRQPISIWEIRAEGRGYIAQLRCQCGGHSDQRMRPVAFSPDGATLASGERKIIHLWDVPSGAYRQSLAGHTERVQSLTFSPTEGLLASGGTDGTVRLWDITQGRQVALLDGHRVRVLSLAFSPDGSSLATADLKTIRLWKIEAGDPQPPLAHVADENSGRAVQLRFVLADHKHFVTAVAFHPSGQLLVSASLDETIRLWDVPTGERLRSLFGYQGAIYGMDVDHQHQHLVTGDVNGAIQLWQIHNTTSLTQADRIAHCPSRILAVAFSPDGQAIAATCTDERLRLWRVSTKTQRFVLHDPAFDFGLGQLAFSPDSTLFAATCSDPSIRLWRHADGRLQHILGGETIQFRCLAFRPDGQMLAAGTQEGRIYAWNLGEANGLALMPPSALLDFVERECITAIKFSPLGEKLIYSANRSVFVMDLASRERHLTLAGDDEWNRALAVSRQGLIAVGGDAGVIRLYDLSSGRCAGILTGHQDRISSLVFAPAGDLLYSSSEDGELKVWDVINQSCLDTVRSALPYAGMKIAGVSGLSEAQKASLRALGAVDSDLLPE